MCRTPKHLCKTNKTHVKGKRKEITFNEIEPENDTTYLEVFDFVKETTN